MRRFDSTLPHKIDISDTGSIPKLAGIGKQAAAGMDWKAILA
jgi:hypothetical protein